MIIFDWQVHLGFLLLCLVLLVIILILHVRAMKQYNDDWDYTVIDVLNPLKSTSDKTFERSKKPEIFGLLVVSFMCAIYFNDLFISSIFTVLGVMLEILFVSNYGSHPSQLLEIIS